MEVVPLRLGTIVLRFRWPVAGTLALLLVENLLLLSIPLVLGWVIDALLVEFYHSLLGLVIIFVALTVIGVARRFYDTRVYTGIYRQLSRQTAQSLWQKGESVSVADSRLEMVAEFTQFLERELAGISTAIFGFFGTLIILALFDWRLTLVATVAMLLSF